MNTEAEKYTILVVDDENTNIRVLSYALRPEYTVYMAKDGRTALEMIKSLMPDLVLLDVIMPDMSGYEVITEMKNTEEIMDIPVIFITGLGGIEDEEKGFLLGAVDYITKPFNNTIVRVRVRHHLQALRQFRMIKRLGIIDPLTDLHNRRGFNDRLDIEWNRAARDGTPLSLLAIDVDRFKLYNDSYGHPQGDLLLQSIAAVLRQTLLRSTDYIARLGGEEFAVLLPGTNLEGAVGIAEQMRASVENTMVPCADGTETHVTISIGVYSQIPKPGELADNMFVEADKLLYQAKESGRNRVIS